VLSVDLRRPGEATDNDGLLYFITTFLRFLAFRIIASLSSFPPHIPLFGRADSKQHLLPVKRHLITNIRRPPSNQFRIFGNTFYREDILAASALSRLKPDVHPALALYTRTPNNRREGGGVGGRLVEEPS
jgi:hypothetical protein